MHHTFSVSNTIFLPGSRMLSNKKIYGGSLGVTKKYSFGTQNKKIDF